MRVNAALTATTYLLTEDLRILRDAGELAADQLNSPGIMIYLGDAFRYAERAKGFLTKALANDNAAREPLATALGYLQLTRGALQNAREHIDLLRDKSNGEETLINALFRTLTPFINTIEFDVDVAAGGGIGAPYEIMQDWAECREDRDAPITDLVNTLEPTDDKEDA